LRVAAVLAADRAEPMRDMWQIRHFLMYRVWPQDFRLTLDMGDYITR